MNSFVRALTGTRCVIAASAASLLMLAGVAVEAADARPSLRQQAGEASNVVRQFLQALADADADGVYRYTTDAYWREFDRAKQASNGDLSTFLRQSPERPVEHLVSCSACDKQQCWTLVSVKTQPPSSRRDTVLFLTRQTDRGRRVFGSYQWTKANRATFDALEGGVCR